MATCIHSWRAGIHPLKQIPILRFDRHLIWSNYTFILYLKDKKKGNLEHLIQYLVRNRLYLRLSYWILNRWVAFGNCRAQTFALWKVIRIYLSIGYRITGYFFWGEKKLNANFSSFEYLRVYLRFRRISKLWNASFLYSVSNLSSVILESFYGNGTYLLWFTTSSTSVQEVGSVSLLDHTKKFCQK